MKKYYLIAKNTWDEILTYRLNFSVWRLRNVLQLLTAYFLWYSVLPHNSAIGGYSRSIMLTYILGGELISAIVFSSRSTQIGDEINNGNLSNFLIKPFSYFRYWIARDVGDKMMNIAFSLVELTIIFLFLRPPFLLQTHIGTIVLFILSVVCAVGLKFFIDLLVSLMAFWVFEVWPMRFLFYILLNFFSGGLFPLNLLPRPIFLFLQYSPFSYLLYFPMKVYLGQLSVFELISGFLTAIVWIFLLQKITMVIWQKGLQVYAAVGR